MCKTDSSTALLAKKGITWCIIIPIQVQIVFSSSLPRCKTIHQNIKEDLVFKPLFALSQYNTSPTRMTLQVCVRQGVDSVKQWGGRSQKLTCTPLMQHQWGPPTELESKKKATHDSMYYFFPVHLISPTISLLWQRDDVVQGRIQIYVRGKKQKQKPDKSGISSFLRATSGPAGQSLSCCSYSRTILCALMRKMIPISTTNQSESDQNVPFYVGSTSFIFFLSSQQANIPSLW